MNSVLLLAPSPDLVYAKDEVQSLLDLGIRVEPLIDDVSHADLVLAIRDQRFDVFWYAGHLTEEGIRLKSGLVTISMLRGLLRDRFRLIVLNTCKSLSLARHLRRQSNTSVVATICDVLDIEAFQLGSLLIQALQQYPLEKAFEQVKTSSYVLLNRSGIGSMDELTKALYALSTELGETKAHVAGLTYRIEALEKTLDKQPLEKSGDVLLKIIIGVQVVIAILLFMQTWPLG